jgi:hypothetical protein
VASGRQKKLAENKALFSAARAWPPKISHLPPKISYFRRQKVYFRWLLAAKKNWPKIRLYFRRPGPGRRK